MIALNTGTDAPDIAASSRHRAEIMTLNYGMSAPPPPPPPSLENKDDTHYCADVSPKKHDTTINSVKVG